MVIFELGFSNYFIPFILFYFILFYWDGEWVRIKTVLNLDFGGPYKSSSRPSLQPNQHTIIQCPNGPIFFPSWESEEEFLVG